MKRLLLAKQHDPYFSIPNIQVVNVDRWGDRRLTLQHLSIDGKLLEKKQADRVLSIFIKDNVEV